MKRLFISFCIFLLATITLIAQSDKWEHFAERIAEQAEQLADKIERQAAKIERHVEANAPRWEAKAERIGQEFEDQWNRDWNIRAEESPDGVFLGIESNTVSRDKAKALGFKNSYGSYVSRIINHSAAAAAGLMPFDYIYGIDDQRTSDNQDLVDILEDYEPGDEVTLHFIRKGENKTLKVILGSSENYDWEAQAGEEDRGFLGVRPGSDEDDDDLNGVTIEVVEKSSAEEMGLKEGDVIIGINGYPVLDWDDVETAISNTKPGESVEIIYKRDSREMSAKGIVKSYEDIVPDEEEGDININLDMDELGEINIDLPEDINISGDWDQEDRAFLGIYTDMIPEEKARKLGFDNPYGSYVTGVLKNTGAEKAGIEPFDYIYGIDEYRVGEEQSLGGILKKFKVGDKANVHFIRKGKKSSVSLTFGRQSDAKKVSRNSCEDPFLGINEVSEDEAQGGVVIDPVKGTTAEDMGLREGDIIVAINGYKMLDWQDITTAIEMLKPGENITVEFERGGKMMKASKPIRSYAETKKCKDCDCGDKDGIVISIDKPDVNIFWNDKKKEKPSAPRIDVGSAKVTVENMTDEESGSLRNKGVDIPQANSLAIENLRLAPNPSTGMFTLEFKLPSSGNTLVRVYNTSGRVIYEYELGNFSGDFNDAVDISQNGPGDYYLQVTQNGKVFTKKIILTKS